MGRLVTQLNEGCGQGWCEGFSQGIHRLLGFASLVGVEETGYKSGW